MGFVVVRSAQLATCLSVSVLFVLRPGAIGDSSVFAALAFRRERTDGYQFLMPFPSAFALHL